MTLRESFDENFGDAVRGSDAERDEALREMMFSVFMAGVAEVFHIMNESEDPEDEAVALGRAYEELDAYAGDTLPGPSLN